MEARLQVDLRDLDQLGLAVLAVIPPAGRARRKAAPARRAAS
jgi:hypothetical protein